MKKVLSLILALVMCLSLCACGENKEPDSTITVEETELVPKIWVLQQTVDEFGDVNANSMTVLASPISGDFSNSATVSSELTGTAFLLLNPADSHYVATFSLLEYGNNPINVLSTDSISFKVKVDETIREFPITLDTNGNFNIGLEKGDYSGDLIFNTLYLNKDIRCILYVGNSQYNFTLKSGNFTDLSDSVGFIPGTGEMSVKEAVLSFLNDEKTSESVNCLIKHANEFTVLNGDEIAVLLNGNKYIEMTCKYNYWTVHSYKDNSHAQIAFFAETSYGRGYEGISELTEANYYMKFDITGDTVIENKHVYSKGNIDITYQIRKIADGIYIVYTLDENGNIAEADRMMLQLNEDISSSSELYSVLDGIIAKYTK